MHLRCAPWLCATLLSSVLHAEVRLPAVFGDHMVLQRDAAVPVYGWCAAGEEVTVRIDGQRHVTRGDEAGRFRVELDPLAAGGPHRLVVTGPDEVAIEDVLVGEVWLASGQSNMNWALSATEDAGAAVAGANHPRLRLFQVKAKAAEMPQADCEGSWAPCTPESAAGFSGVGYHFGRRLLEELDVPIGVIQSAWGGTPAESWVPRGAFEAVPELAHFAEDPGGGDSPRRPSVLWNGMIRPLVPFGMRGAIWYQGEANVSRAYQYRSLFPLLIESWRRAWSVGDSGGAADFPFYFVQLAPWGWHLKRGIDPAAVAELREAQTMALELPNTGMVVTMDVGDPDDIHPRDKRTVGERLALWALARDHDLDLVHSGPLYRAIVADEGALRVRFLHATSLGTSDDAPPTTLQLAGADQVFHPAVGRIEGSELIVSSPQVPVPLAVRYGWCDACAPNLVNGAGLPASPFRSDDWPGVTHDAK